MPNIGTVLKAEITRLSRKALKSETEVTRNAVAQHRRYIADLRRQVAQLERQVATLQKGARRAAASSDDAPGKRVRFSPKGLRSHRERLGLSAGDYGRLIGVSAQSIYNWERETASPREAQKVRLAAVRALGSRAARARLEAIDGSSK
jgi:DNA-binding transcriptional regulator YiaG